MISKINWHPDKNEVRKSGLGILAGAIIVFIILALTRKMEISPAMKIFIPIGVMGLLMIVLPKVFKFVYYVWMGIAYVIGNIVSPIILFIFYFIFISPFAIILRLVRKSPLNLKFEKKKTYWIDFNKVITKENFERQS